MTGGKEGALISDVSAGEGAKRVGKRLAGRRNAAGRLFLKLIRFIVAGMRYIRCLEHIFWDNEALLRYCEPVQGVHLLDITGGEFRVEKVYP